MVGSMLNKKALHCVLLSGRYRSSYHAYSPGGSGSLPYTSSCAVCSAKLPPPTSAATCMLCSVYTPYTVRMCLHGCSPTLRAPTSVAKNPLTLSAASHDVHTQATPPYALLRNNTTDGSRHLIWLLRVMAPSSNTVAADTPSTKCTKG